MQVNLGVTEANPASTEGCITNMEKLHTCVPTVEEDVLPILCNGDATTIERIVAAQHARANGATPKDRMEGLVASPQEFHKEMILLGVGLKNTI